MSKVVSLLVFLVLLTTSAVSYGQQPGFGNATSIQNFPVSPTAPASGQCLGYNGTQIIWGSCAGSGGTGTVTNVSGLSPLFTVATPTTTPTFSLSSAAADTVFGNCTTGSTTPSYCSVTAAMLPVFGTAAAGIVPLSGGGTTNFLRADGTWAAPAGGGAVISVFGRTGAVVAATSDYNFNQLAGSLGTAQGPSSLTGLLKDAAGTLSAASAGTDYLTPTGSATGLSKASAVAFGVSECDGTTITCSGGIFSATTGGGGNVSNVGTPTNGQLAQWTGATTIQGFTTGTGVITWLTTPSSANLAAAITDETGTGLAVFGTSPTLITPLLGIPTSGVITNLTGTCTACTANSAGSVTNALTMNNGGAGAVSGSTYNGSAAQTISYNTVGASPLAGSTSIVTVGTIATGTWAGTTIAANHGGTGVANTATLTLGTSNQNWATLGTGIVKNTTTTGAITDAASADVIGLWTGTCSSTTFLRGDGACITPSGSGNTTSTSLTTNTIPVANGANSIINSLLTDNGTTLTYTGTGGFSITSSSSGSIALGGSSSGTATITVPAAAGTPTITLGSNSGTPAVTATSPLAISTSTGNITCTTCGVTGSGLNQFASTTSAQLLGIISDPTGTGSLVFANTPTLITPVIGAATGTSLLATGNVDGTAPITVTTGTTATLGGTFRSGYTYNQEATAATAVTYTLPTAAAGRQYCIGNGYNGTAATTGVLTLATSATGQFIIFTDGTLSATGGNITSGGAAADAACVTGVDATHWQLYVQRGTWTKH